MKKILLPTDFSAHAENAARYAIELATSYDADVVLTNAFLVPVEALIASRLAWPLLDYETLHRESMSDLEHLLKKLRSTSKQDEAARSPHITLESHPGSVFEVTSDLVNKKKFDLVIMGMTGAGVLPQIIFGSNCRTMIEKASFPVLYVPAETKYKAIEKIGFATDLSIEDVEIINDVLQLFRREHIQLKLIHITKDEIHTPSKTQVQIDGFIKLVQSKISNTNITYEYVSNTDVDNGLSWLTQEFDINILAMLHRHHSFITGLLHGSHTHKVRKHAMVPLLVMPPDKRID